MFDVLAHGVDDESFFCQLRDGMANWWEKEPGGKPNLADIYTNKAFYLFKSICFKTSDLSEQK